MFGWDYNTQYICCLSREYGHIGAKCMRTHFKKTNPTKRCYVCKELGHLEKNYVNRATIEDEKKTKVDKLGLK